MEKSLKTVQTFAKIAKVVALILFICICIGAFFVLISALFVQPAASVMGDVINNFDGYVSMENVDPAVLDLIEWLIDSGLITKAMYAGLAFAFLGLAVSGVITMMAYVTFKREVNDGTPFTFRFAKDLNRLGWVKLCLTIGFTLFSSISAAMLVPGNSFKVTFEFAEISGIIYIIIAAICKYGAYVAEQKKEAPALPVEPTEPAETEIPESTEPTEE